MLKRKQMLSAAMTSMIIAAGSLPGSASAACGGQPPLPPEGLAWPARGQIVKPWSLNCSTDSGHRGIDMALPEGTIIGAAADGIVSFVGYTPAEGGGTTVSITHDTGMKSTYLHISRVSVNEGGRVSQGELIGLSGGVPVHFGIKMPGAREIYYDPALYLTGSGTVHAVPETILPLDNTMTVPVDNAIVAPAETVADMADTTAAAASISANEILGAANEPSVITGVQRNPDSMLIVTTIPAPAPVNFPIGGAVVQPSPIPGLTSVSATPALSSDKSFEPSMAQLTKGLMPAQSRHENAAEKKLPPFRNSIVPLITILLITAIFMRNRMAGRTPSFRTA